MGLWIQLEGQGKDIYRCSECSIRDRKRVNSGLGVSGHLTELSSPETQVGLGKHGARGSVLDTVSQTPSGDKHLEGPFLDVEFRERLVLRTHTWEVSMMDVVFKVGKLEESRV